MNIKDDPQMDMSPERKFQALLMLYNNHAELLRFISTHDLKIFGTYLPIQIALGGWLSQGGLLVRYRIPMLALDASITFIAASLIHKSTQRRKQVHALFDKVNDALLFFQHGSYLQNESLMPNPETRRLWGNTYIFGIIVAFLAIAWLIFSGGVAVVPAIKP